MTSALAEQFAGMGVRVKTSKTKAEPVFEVWDMNWPAMRAFLALQTQWRTATLSTMERARLVYLGLDYSAIEPTLRLAGIKRTKRLFAQLQLLERGALDAYRELAA